MTYTIDRKFQRAASEFLWGTLFKGIIILIFGLLAITWPGLTLASLTIAFALYILIAGVINLVLGIVGISHVKWWPLHFILGFIELGAGVFALRNPDLTLTSLIIILGLLLIARGVFELVAGLVNEWFTPTTRTLYGIMGTLSVLAGILILLYPASGGLAFVWVLGLYSLGAGIILVAISLELRVLLEESRK